MADVIIPIVFPDYQITAFNRQWGDLGHAGILLIHGGNGLTKYYEYGRYDPANRGLVRNPHIPDVIIDKTTGEPTRDSLAETLHTISSQSGNGTRISGAYIKVQSGFQLAVTYADNRMKQNTNPNRPEYGLMTNNCGTFMRQTAVSAGVAMPLMADPRPNIYIREVQNAFTDLEYDPANKTLTIR